jgi:hypothetical protein
MAISAGDAIFNFLGDATQLDQTWTKVEADATAKAPAVQAQVNTVGQAWEQAGQSAQVAADQSTKAGAEIGAAAQGAAATSSAAVQAVDSSWLALARATDTATRATIEHKKAQAELDAAIKAAVVAEEGDTQALTALATAEEKVATTGALLAAAQREVEVASHEATAGIRAEAEAALESELALKAAADAALKFGVESEAAGERSAESMRRAAGTAQILGNEIGVTGSYQVGKFLQQFPLVAQAMETAFSGLAIILLIQLIVQATEKLTEFVSETFIYTDAEKKQYEATLELNKALTDQATKLVELQKAYQLINLEGSAKTRKEFELLTEEVNKNEAALRAAQNTLAKYRLEQESVDFSAVHDVTKEEADKAAETILRLTSLLKVQAEQQAAISKQFDKEALDEQIKHGEASINAEKTIMAARIELARAESELKLTLAKAGYSSFIDAQQHFAEQQYQLTLKSLRETLALVSQDPTRNVDRIKELHAQIEALEEQHQTKLVELRLKGVQALQAAIKQALSQTTATPVDDIIPLPSEVNQRVQEITDILAQFGIKSGQVWQDEVDKTQAALDKVRELGDGIADLSVAMLQLAEKNLTAKIGLAIDKGDLALAEQFKDELAGIRVVLDQLTGAEEKNTAATDKLNRSHNSTIQLLDHWSAEMRKQRKDLSDTQKAFDDVILDTSAAFGNAVSRWVLGQESLGRALRESLAEEAASIAGRAIMWGLYWTAWGIADSFWNPGRAGADFASAAEFFAVAAIAGSFAYGIKPGQSGGGETAGAPDGTKPIETTPVSETQTAPTTTTQVQRFASGGMVFGPTMAILGDAASSANTAAALSGPGQTEIAIPLDDDRTTSAFAEAIFKHMPRETPVVHIHGASLRELIKKISHTVEKGGVQLTSSRTRSVRKKS